MSNPTNCTEPTCRKLIVFLPSARGTVPVDFDSITPGDRRFLPLSGHVNHYATCTRPQAFGKKAKAGKAVPS